MANRTSKQGMGFEGVVGGTGGTGSVVGVGRKRAFGAFNSQA